MILNNKRRKLLMISLPAVLILMLAAASISQPAFGTAEIASPDPGLTITIDTNRESYLLRQKVIFQGSINDDGVPASNLVIPMQVEDPMNAIYMYRTLTIGNPTQSWPLNITNLSLLDSENNPINTAKTGTTIQARMTIFNWQLTPRETYATVTVFDANMVPIKAGYWIGTIYPHDTSSPRFTIYMPSWACSGKALICGNVYSKEPKTGGIALSLEKTAYYCVSRTQTGFMTYPQVPPPGPQTTPGTYKTNITLPPEPSAGTYKVYVVGQASPVMVDSASVTFNAENSAGYPPQASFVFWPAQPYINQTVSFDASSSTPEGFDDEIIKYEWNFGDGTPKVAETDPYISHNFAQAKKYVVTLNVTDSEGLWSTTSKPLTTLPEFGPTANFTWIPKEPIINETITFNGANSTTGWCARTQRFSPIQSYKWNFGDGTGDIITASTLINHNYTQPNNYTVKLTVTDADGRFDDVTAIVRVQNITQKMFDVNDDGTIDLKDVYRVAKAYGSYPGHPRWDPACDFNRDNKVDLKDYYPVCQRYGQDP